MKKIFLTTIFSLTIIAQSVFGHGGHYEMNKEEASQNAKTQVEKLVTETKLPESWKSANLVTAETTNIAGKKRWVVVFENAQESDAAKKKLEVVLTPGGKFVSQQFSK